MHFKAKFNNVPSRYYIYLHFLVTATINVSDDSKVHETNQLLNHSNYD